MLHDVMVFRIFVVPMFGGPLISQSLMLNRRNDTQDTKLQLFGKTASDKYVHVTSYVVF